MHIMHQPPSVLNCCEHRAVFVTALSHTCSLCAATAVLGARPCLLTLRTALHCLCLQSSILCHKPALENVWHCYFSLFQCVRWHILCHMLARCARTTYRLSISVMLRSVCHTADLWRSPVALGHFCNRPQRVRKLLVVAKRLRKERHIFSAAVALNAASLCVAGTSTGPRLSST